MCRAPEPCQRRFYVDAVGVRLHYLEHGDNGPNLLLLPGIISPAIAWAFVAEKLATCAHVYTLDNRGRGLSEHRPGLGYRLDDYASDVDQLIRTLGIGPVILLGHSMGARIAVRVAACYPDLVSRVILADPPVSGPGRRPYPLELQFYLANIAEAARGAPLPIPPNWTEEQCRIRAEWLPSCSEEAVTESYRSMHEEDFHADLPSITAPLTLLYAERGGTITEQEAAEIVSLVPNARSVLIRGVGHMMPWDDLDGFVAAVLSSAALDPKT